MEKMKMHSKNLTQENIAKIAELFPNCVTEVNDETSSLNPHPSSLRYAVDFDQLRQELSESIVEGPQERYHLNWPGKREALLTANAPIAKTLRPCREESVDFDATKNLFIEGDNLDALKLLQETYLGKVKMIYIDPPYNTGNDFIYKDDFAENVEGFLKRSNQKDEEGNRLVANTESNGRFHSDWLSMIYPRLKLARNLLRDDGVIFISIDDGEVANLKRMCDEIFGEDNFVANVIWEKKFAPQNDEKYITASHDHIILYSREKSSWTPNLLPRSGEALKKFKNPDNDPRGVWTSGDLTSKTKAANHSYPITSPGGKVFYPPTGRQWAPSLHTFDIMLGENRIWFGESGDNVPRIKQFLSEVQNGVVPMSIWKYQEVGHNQSATQELKILFDNSSIFDSPKPTTLLQRILFLASESDGVILDFFAGSSTTAQAVMQINAEDGGNRKFIMVQLPEPCDEKSETFKAGYKTIAEISKERIRRAGKKISADCVEKRRLKEKEKSENLFSEADEGNNLRKSAQSADKLDIGFRVLKVDSSNMADVFYTPNASAQQDLFRSVENIKPDRMPEDLLFQVLLDWGVDLSLPIRKQTVKTKSEMGKVKSEIHSSFEVYFVDENSLVACFDKGVNEELVKELARFEPLRVVFRDNGFASDAVKINAEQIFKQLSPYTEVKTI